MLPLLFIRTKALERNNFHGHETDSFSWTLNVQTKIQVLSLYLLYERKFENEWYEGWGVRKENLL